MCFTVYRHTGEWATVGICTGISETKCDLASLIDDNRMKYKVRVQLTAGDKQSEWIMKKFLPAECKHSQSVVIDKH